MECIWPVSRLILDEPRTLTPEGAAFLQQEGSCCHYSVPCQDQHSQLKTFPHSTGVPASLSPTKPFSEIYSTALVLIGAAHWGGILQTFVNVSTKLVGLSCKGEKWDLSWGQKMKRYRNLKQSLSFSSVTQLWLWMCLHWISHRFDRYFWMFPCCSSEKY